jgi:hypothetical protein
MDNFIKRNADAGGVEHNETRRSTDNATKFRRRTTDKVWYKTFPLAAIISAASLAWYISVSWVNFRDTVFSSCHAIELRVASVEAYRLAHELGDVERYRALIRLEDRMEKFPTPESMQSTIDRLEAKLDAIK